MNELKMNELKARLHADKLAIERSELVIELYRLENEIDKLKRKILNNDVEYFKLIKST